MKKLIAFLLFFLSVSAIAQTSGHVVTVTFNASTDAQLNPSLTYNIYRSSGDCSNTLGLTKIGSVATLSFDDIGVAPGTYCYTARSFLNGAESVNANLALTVIVPAAPSGVKTQPK